jgi:DUF4097 and DUF4098 domain-containing protein YvlB
MVGGAIFMKTTLVLILLLITVPLFATEIRKEFQVQPGKTVDINLKTGGDIEIEGWNKDIVSIQGYLTANHNEDCEIVAEQNAAGVSIRSHYSGDRDDYNVKGEIKLQVPDRFNVQVESMGGDIRIHGVEGDFDGQTMGGALILSELKGKISLDTMGGKIELTNSDLDGNVSTMGGNVLLENVSGNVKGSSMGGKVIKRGKEISSGQNTSEVDISSMGGALNVDSAPHGANLDTMGGNISVRSASDHVRAKTMGGDIQIDSIDGWVRAETYGGDIVVKMTGDPSQGNREIQLTSLSGDIELTVPQNLAMDLDLELAYTHGKEGRYSIKSDFPLKTKESKEWDNRDGSPRKYIYGSGTVGSGKNRVRISTINGDIIIHKS